MASAQELLQEACDSGIACLEPGQLLIVYAQGLASTLGMNAQELLQAACDSGMACLDPGQLSMVIAEASRQAAANGGGGGGDGDCCPAGVGSPEGVVTAEPGASYLDTSTDEFWLKRTGSGNVGWFLKVA